MKRRSFAEDPVVARFERLLDEDEARVVAASNQSRWNVGDVDVVARGMADRLPPLPRDTLIGLSVRSGPGFLAALLAARRAGLVAALLDADAPLAEQRRIVTALGAAALVRCAPWPSGPGEFEVEAGVETPRLVRGAFVVKLTSGSTGVPRGVVVPAEAALADSLALHASMGIRDDDALLAGVPMSYSYGFGSLAIPALALGQRIEFAPPGDPMGALRTCAADVATVFPTTPAAVHAMVRRSTEWHLAESIRLVVAAGAPIRARVAEAFRTRFGRAVHAFYGASECGGVCFDRTGLAAERGSVGTPVEGVEVSLTPERLVVVRSPAVATGYLEGGDARLGDGRFVTGDLGRLRDGELELIGRHGTSIDVGGRQVEPAEIEGALLRMRGVHDALVTGITTADGRGVCCAIVATHDPELTRRQVLAHCRGELAPHKVPRSIRIVDSIPRTSRGKPDARAASDVVQTRRSG